MKPLLILLAALAFFVQSSGGFGEPQKLAAQKIGFATLTNGVVLQGEASLPLEVKIKHLDGISLTANGGPVPGGVIIHTNSAGRWFLDWDTQECPNGIYDVYLEADSGDDSYYSATNTITVSNMISFDPFGSYGSQMWIHARLAVQHADWKVKMLDSDSQYVGYFEGTTTNGFISFIWKFQDINGRTLPGGPFYSSEISVTPLDNCKTELPTNHPNLQLASSSFPLPDKIPRKLIPPEKVTNSR